MRMPDAILNRLEAISSCPRLELRVFLVTNTTSYTTPTETMSSPVDILLPNGLTYSQPTGLFINNEFIAGSGESFDVLNPS